MSEESGWGNKETVGSPEPQNQCHSGAERCVTTGQLLPSLCSASLPGDKALRRDFPVTRVSVTGEGAAHTRGAEGCQLGATGTKATPWDTPWAMAVGSDGSGAPSRVLRPLVTLSV